ncbi:hypothetical protein E1A91_A11G172700v1 [Gossypium mustelinum]|uniref:RCC1-like domain-containing protein n=2 Tax=Gossypium TaxID=3633 RepID=A0A5D2X7K7_GOSMU|nr:ultraviolet-B receptor UVR8-like isoform X2 [Gossypium hirsutum]TYJ09919.1 hypothetical protein E1A91_A11G172700v1 [Gossypium mustelinum]TYJ09921.1 hypothetical protein E1A91_A11G172700v1 [Gossypium mustelinum]
MDIETIMGETMTRSQNIPTKSAIYVWGYNHSGQTGRRGKEQHLRIPKQLSPDLFGCPAGANSRWLDIACGREHTAAVASDGSLFTWGANEFGQLGDGTEKGRKNPKKVKQLQTEFVKFVSCGAHCTAAIAEPRENDGTISKRRLWIWGQNQVIRQVSCGAAHVVALSEEGLLQAWGYNEYGQLGRGITSEGLQGARVINAYAKFLDEAPELVKITQVSCGEYHTAAVSEKGEVYTWGLGNMGQLGHSSLQSGDKELLPRRIVALDGICIKDVACGGVHTCALTSKGALYAWGGGQVGQLGLGPQTGFFSCNPNDSFFRNIPALVVPTGVQLVACGHSHTLICLRDGRINGWGYNNYGQAANQKSIYAWYPSPVDWCVGEVRKLAAGGGHSAVLTDACSLKELCEFRLAECVTLSNAAQIGDVASRTGADALARLCERLREHHLHGGGFDDQDDIKNMKS